MEIGCSLPSMTFMPEYKKNNADMPALEGLLYGYNTAKSVGYDYIEAAVGVIMKLTETEVDTLCSAMESGSFELKYCNCFVPPEIKLCTEDFAVVERFVKSVMSRLNRLKVRTVIFGSGYARAYPDGMTVEQGLGKIREFLRLCANEGEKYGITTAVEPLNSTETNIITTVDEGAKIVREINNGKISLLPDCFHMGVENEEPDIICRNLDIVDHIHVSERPNRVYPGKFGGEYLKKVGDVLGCSGYDKDITVECCFDDFELEAQKAFEFVCLNMKKRG